MKYIHCRILFSHIEVPVFCENTDKTRGHYVKLIEPGTESKILHILFYIWKGKKKYQPEDSTLNSRDWQVWGQGS